VKIGDLTNKNGSIMGISCGYMHDKLPIYKQNTHEKWLINGFIDDLPMKNG
jgi:hypothetical protein